MNDNLCGREIPYLIGANILAFNTERHYKIVQFRLPFLRISKLHVELINFMSHTPIVYSQDINTEFLYD